MMKTFRKTGWLYLAGYFVLILFGSDNGFSQTDRYVIKGRVVDTDGQGVMHAGICLEPVEISTAFDNFVECVGSGPDGTFKLEKIRNEFTDVAKQELYIYFGTSGDTLETIVPPFYGLQRFDKKFHGAPLVFGQESLIDIGDVTIQFWYGQVNLDFSRYKASKGLATIDWEGLYLRIRTSRGKIVYGNTLSHDDIYEHSYIDRAEDLLKLSIPEGRWKIEVLWKGGVRAASPFFEVSRETRIKTVLRPA
jgi:hypothetical protein